MFVVSEYAACFLIMLAVTGMLIVMYGIGYAVKAIMVRVIPARYFNHRAASPTVVEISL